jgi:hypothetical protein
LNLGVLHDEEIRSLLAASSKRDEDDLLKSSEMFSASAEKLENEDLFFWAAIAWEYEAKSLLSLLGHENKRELIDGVEAAFLKAAQNYGLEAEIYLEHRCYLLAQRARSDKSWCESQVKNLAVK